MKQWLQDWWQEQRQRDDYYDKMARWPLLMVEMVAVGVVVLSQALNFFPNFFKAMMVAVLLLSMFWRLFIYFGAKHRPDRWDKF